MGDQGDRRLGSGKEDIIGGGKGSNTMKDLPERRREKFQMANARNALRMTSKRSGGELGKVFKGAVPHHNLGGGGNVRPQEKI